MLRGQLGPPPVPRRGSPWHPRSAGRVVPPGVRFPLPVRDLQRRLGRGGLPRGAPQGERRGVRRAALRRAGRPASDRGPHLAQGMSGGDGAGPIALAPLIERLDRGTAAIRRDVGAGEVARARRAEAGDYFGYLPPTPEVPGCPCR